MTKAQEIMKKKQFINDLWGRSAPWGALFLVSWWKY